MHAIYCIYLLIKKQVKSIKTNVIFSFSRNLLTKLRIDTDYMRDLLLHGLKRWSAKDSTTAQSIVVDSPRIDHMYLYPEDQPVLKTEQLYG